MPGVSHTVDAAEGMWRRMLEMTCDAAAAADESRDDNCAPRCCERGSGVEIELKEQEFCGTCTKSGCFINWHEHKNPPSASPVRKRRAVRTSARQGPLQRIKRAFSL
jgi:hypothetical protein